MSPILAQYRSKSTKNIGFAKTSTSNSQTVSSSNTIYLGLNISLQGEIFQYRNRLTVIPKMYDKCFNVVQLN